MDAHAVVGPAKTAASVVGISSFLVGLLALSVLAGWLFDVRALKSVLLQLTTMKANTALCLGLLAAGIGLSRTAASRARNRGWILALAVLVAGVALLTSAEYIFHWDAGIDQLFFRDPEHMGTGYPAGRCAPGTAFCLTLLSAALATLDLRPRLSQTLILIALFAALLGLIGYLFGLSTIYGAVRFTSLALHTVFGLLVLCAGLLACRPDCGATRLLISAHKQRAPTPLLAAGAVVLPTFLGAASLYGQRMGWYGSEFTLALFTVLLIVFSLALVGITEIERQRIEADRLNTEQALRESEERFHTLADNVPNLMWMAHPNGDVFWYNQRWYEYTGTTFDEMKGWGWQKVHDPKMLPLVMAQWESALATGGRFEMVFPLLGKDGVFCPFLTRIQPVFGPDGRLVRWFGTNTDISAERQTLEELRRANRQLEEYAYVSAHDLQEPLRMVTINTDLLLADLEGRLPPSAEQHAQGIRIAASLMGQLIKDLLQFSRTITAPALEETNLPTADLNVCLSRALTALSAALLETRAKVRTTHLPIVQGEASQLTQVFQNVLSNALKYRNKRVEPVVRISARREHHQWVVSIEDNGIGFDPAFAQRIFGLFKRLHRDEYPGTGLGLAICQRIVERYGGRIWAEGRPGVGSTFHIALQTAAEPMSTRVETQSKQVHQTSNTMQVARRQSD